MIKFLKLVAKGRKALVPKPTVSREATNDGTNPIRSHSRAVDSASKSYIPNRSVTVVKDRYTPPPKSIPFAIIPKGVCKNCD